MFVRPFATLLLIAALVVPALAQEQRGSIEGVVRDASGAVLPGATVEAQSNVGPRGIDHHRRSRRFRFPSLAPGQLQGDREPPGLRRRAKSSTCASRSARSRRSTSRCRSSGVTETVQVTAETPIIDVRQSARQTNIRAEQVELLPHGRDFTTMVTQAPGANQESKLGGISIDGASAGENRFIIDGIETTNLQTGLSGTNLIADFVEEVQVKSSGFSAEFGGALGGVISAVTKSGTNNFSGMALYNFQGSATEGSRRPTLRQNLTNSDIAEYITLSDDDTQPASSRASRSAARSSSDRMWFFGAYLPAMTTDRSHGQQRTRSTRTRSFAEHHRATSPAQPSDSIRARASPTTARAAKLNGLLPALNGTDPVGTNYSKSSEFPNFTRPRATWTGWPRRSCCSASAAATARAISTTRT